MSQKNFMSYEDAVAIVSEIASQLGLKVDSSAIGTNGGIAELDSTGKVPSSQLPSFVDDVLEYDSLSKFPATGEAGKIYVAKDTNKTYRWSGSAYVEISPSLALGETSSTAYRGDRGKTAYTHATDSGRLTTATASGLYKVASTAQGHIAGLTAVTKADITGLGIPGSDTNTTYTFANGTNQFTVTPSGGSAQTVKVTPSFTVATGDANGQVKIDGKNADVKGLGTAAYTASTAYVASMNGTHTGELKLFREGTTDDNVSTRLIFSNKNTTTGSTSTGYIDAFNGGANGANMVIRPGGNLFLGSGESATNHFNAGFAQSTGEVLYIDSDNQIHLQANAQTIANRVGAQIDTSGNIIPEKADVATNNIGGIGTSSYKWANGYFTNINGVEVGTPKFTDASVYQSATTTADWRKILLGKQTGSSGAAVVATTDQSYVSPSLEFQPSTGTLKATKFDGPATSAAKLTTARSVALGGNLNGSANFDGSANITINGDFYSCSVSGNNKANFPWHRIAYCTNKTGTYSDTDALFLIRRCYNDGSIGIIKVSLRTNGSGAACSVSARWLLRIGFAVNDIVIAHWGVTGDAVYADIFCKCSTYPRTVVHQIAGGRSFTLVNSNEVSNTTATDKLTSVEVYKDVATAATEIHGKAYTSTKDAIDAATVNYANNAGTVNGKTVESNVPANAKFTDTTYTASTTSVGSASAGTAIAADDITAWSAGSVPSLTITNTACDDITAWNAGTMTSASYSKGVLTITNGSAPSLSYTARSVGSASGWSAGTAPSLSYTARSIPNISVSSKTVVTGIVAG